MEVVNGSVEPALDIEVTVFGQSTTDRRQVRMGHSPWGSKTQIRSCGASVVLVDEPAEQVPPADVPRADQAQVIEVFPTRCVGPRLVEGADNLLGDNLLQRHSGEAELCSAVRPKTDRSDRVIQTRWHTATTTANLHLELPNSSCTWMTKLHRNVGSDRAALDAAVGSDCRTPLI